MPSEDFEFIDAHHHLWDLRTCNYPWLMARGEQRFFGDPTPIQRDYLPADFLAESSRYRPSRSVHIQVGVAEQDAVRETAWLQGLDKYPHAIVAYCDLSQPDALALLRAHQRYSRLRGIRQIVGRHPREDRRHGTGALLENPLWRAGLNLLAPEGLSFDLQLIPAQIPALRRILERSPDLPVAICHCASPWDQSARGLARWRSGLATLAALPNTVCKVSGVGMFNPGWRTQSLRPVVDSVIEMFSPERVMFGSNFPVDKLYRDYEPLWDAYRELTVQFSAAEQRQMFCGTAARFYRLNWP